MDVVIISNQVRKNNPGNKDIINPVILNLNKSLVNVGVNVENLYYYTPTSIIKSYLVLFKELFFFKISKKRYDVFHVHFGGLQGLIVSLIMRNKAVISFHGTDLHGGTPNTFLSKIKSKINVICSILSIYLISNATVVSKNLLDYIPEKLHKKVSVIPTGINKDSFNIIPKNDARSKLSLKLDKIYFLFSDISGSSVKRRDIAEAVIDILNKRGIDVELLVMSKVGYSDVPSYVCASDFVFITSDKEGSPNIVKEALFCGVRVISTDVGDVSDYINSEEYGLILSNNNPKQIASQIYDYLHGGVDFKLDINYPKEFLLMEYIADKYKELYEKL